MSTLNRPLLSSGHGLAMITAIENGSDDHFWLWTSNFLEFLKFLFSIQIHQKVNSFAEDGLSADNKIRGYYKLSGDCLPKCIYRPGWLPWAELP